MSTFKMLLMIGVLLIVSPGLSKAQNCQEYLDMIEKHMPPEVGNPDALEKLLRVKSNNWVGKIDVSEVLKVLKDDPYEQHSLRGYPISVLTNDHSIMKCNLVKGEVRYINRKRGFMPNNADAFDYKKGMGLVQGLLATLKLPSDEFGKIEGKILKGGAIRYKAKTLLSQTKHDVETTYFVSRKINGIPALTSVAIAAVSNKGEISRFRVRWPVVKIDPKLHKAKAISRKKVAKIVYKTIFENQGCTHLERFGAYVAYVSLKGDVQDEDKTPDEAKPIFHVPKLVVYYRSVNPDEAGEELLFDLYQ
jgi:hypothetical protein